MKAQNDLKEMKVSVFKNVFIKVPIDEKPIEYLLEQIRINLDYEISVNLVRNELDKLKTKKAERKTPLLHGKWIL